VFGALALLTGSIVPVMIVHALVDLQAGMAGYAGLRGAEGEGAAPPVRSMSASSPGRG
jgi:hypothetical protein